MALALDPLASELDHPWPRPSLRLLEPLEPSEPIEPLEPQGPAGLAGVDWTPARPVRLGCDVAVRRRIRASTRVRRRRTVVGLVAGGLLTLLALPAGALGGHSPARSPLRLHDGIYVVQPGDTLWSIASRFDPNGDPRPFVAELEAEIGSDQVAPGEHLRLP